MLDLRGERRLWETEHPAQVLGVSFVTGIGKRLDVEPKLHDVLILHDGVLTLHADGAGSF